MKKFFTLIAVAVMAFAAQANVLTVADGGATNSYAPLYGLYTDTENTMIQMIYPQDMLTDMVNGKISQVKFFLSDEAGIHANLNGAEIQLSFKVVEQDCFTEGAIEAVAGTAVVSSLTLAEGMTEIVFTLDEPFEYTGGNLLIETLVTTPAGYRTTYFYGMTTENIASIYQYVWSTWSGPSINSNRFLPKAEFTYEAGEVTPPTPTQMTAAPTFNGYTEDGIHAYFVEILPTEPSTIYYRVIYPDGTESEWTEYDDILSFTGNGKYRVEAYAVAPGKLQSYGIAYEFVVSPFTGIEEMNADKAVAGVRYFNMAGQEMSQPQGLTIKVTTYTDGTTSSVKVMK